MVRSRLDGSFRTQWMLCWTSLFLVGVFPTLAGAQIDPNQDVSIYCPVYDHEILDNVMAFQAPPAPVGNENLQQLSQKLWAAHLASDPDPGNITTATVLDIAPTIVDGNLPPLALSLN